MTRTDIFDTDFKLPSKVYILGSGATAATNYRLIPDGAFIIALNRAIELPIKAAIWLCHDTKLAERDWFKTQMETVEKLGRDVGPKSVKRIDWPTPIFSEQLAKDIPYVRITFRTEGGEIRRPWDASARVLRVGATIAGVALQFCHYKGVREVVLVGVDLVGGYFNGQPHEDPRIGADGIWPLAKAFEWVYQSMIRKGMKLSHIDDPATDTGQEPDIKTVDSTEQKGGASVVSSIPIADSQTSPIPPADTTDLPTIGYLCMSYDPIDKMNAVFDFDQQDWPNDRKILYLLHQRDSFGQFPGPTFNNRGLQIVDVNCEGFPWPEMWTFKFMEYLRTATTRYTLWWDEDDRYPSDYTRKAMEPILERGARLSWSWDMTVAEYVVTNARFEYRVDWYRSPIATLVIETDMLRKYANRLWSILYEGEMPMKSTKRKRGIPYGGAQDDQLRQMIQHDLDPIPHHRGEKLYFVHGDANSAQLRSRGNALDYKGKRGTEEEREAQPTRFDYPRS